MLARALIENESAKEVVPLLYTIMACYGADMYEVALLLHNIRSAHNVGSVFRTADAAGVRHVFLTGYTPRPTDRFGVVQKDIAKTALGAQEYLQWEYYKSPAPLLRKLKKDGWQIVGIEQDARARDYQTFKAAGTTVFVVGNEVLGLSKPLRDMCDILVEIPMRGRKESLNVSVAAGIILFSCIS